MSIGVTRSDISFIGTLWLLFGEVITERQERQRRNRLEGSFRNPDESPAVGTLEACVETGVTGWREPDP